MRSAGETAHALWDVRIGAPQPELRPSAGLRARFPARRGRAARKETRSAHFVPALISRTAVLIASMPVRDADLHREETERFLASRGRCLGGKRSFPASPAPQDRPFRQPAAVPFLPVRGAIRNNAIGNRFRESDPSPKVSGDRPRSGCPVSLPNREWMIGHMDRRTLFSRSSARRAAGRATRRSFIAVRCVNSSIGRPSPRPHG